MKPESTRACIYAKDVQRLTGRSDRSARTLLEKIRKALNKNPNQFITLDEFSQYTGISKDVVLNYIID